MDLLTSEYNWNAALFSVLPSNLLSPKQEAVKSRATYLWAAGEERFDVDVGVVDFEVVISEPPGHADGGQHPRLHSRGGFNFQQRLEHSQSFP